MMRKRESERQVTSRGRTVTFLLPGGGTYPVGGFRVAYEYANGLADRGWQVRIVHPCILSHEEIEAVRASSFLRTRRWLGYQRRRITGRYRPDTWFVMRPNVEMLCTKTLEARYLPSSDAWVATYWYTAKWAAPLPGARLYLIQHLETWCGPEKEVMATWKLPFQKVVISRWLEDVARNLGEPSDYIPNGLNFGVFGMDVAPERRDPHTVSMLYHVSKWKGSAEGLSALHKVKAKVPHLKAIVFGVYPRPAGLPDWVEYCQNSPQGKLREIYNQAAIFVSPSWTEGWPLPPAEALQCGAALVATDIGGHREYAQHEETALLCPTRDPDALAANILRLLENQELRLRLARQGHEYIQRFTWDRAVTGFESVLKQALGQTSSEGAAEERAARNTESTNGTDGNTTFLGTVSDGNFQRYDS
jgi:glycosyltransferase involved in cell wall biosynthesis